MSDVTSKENSGPQPLQATDGFGLLANQRTRQVLAIVRERTGGLTEQDLATVLASRDDDVPLHEVTDEQRKSALTSLQHHHLPKLESHSLVEYDEERLTLTETPALEAGGYLSTGLDLTADDAAKDLTFEMLASEKRRAVITELRDDGEMAVSDLVAAVAARTGRDEGDVVVALHHAHLPKLDDYGVVDFDADAGQVTYEGLPVDDETWLDRVLTDEMRLDGGRHTAGESDIWTLRGRANVVERGQALFDRAEDELFLMVTTDGLLEPECIEKLHDALDRGVDVYLGSQTSEVRDLVREEAPNVTIWEPQLNWLNLPPSDETLGRLVMADREAVMLGTLGQETTDGTYPERALTGEGHANPLVVLMRETLGSRLEHLDGQSDDVLSQFPL